MTAIFAINSAYTDYFAENFDMPAATYIFEGDGNQDGVADAASNVNDLTLTWNGTPGYGSVPTNSLSSYSFEVDETGDKFLIGSPRIFEQLTGQNSLRKVTVAFWARPSSLPSENLHIFSSFNGTNGGALIRYDPTVPGFEIINRPSGGTAQTITVNSTVPQVSEWFHCVGVWDCSNDAAKVFRLYINGELVNTSSLNNWGYASIDGFRVGSSPHSGLENFRGSIADLRIWTRDALTLAQIKNVYSGKIPRRSGIRVYSPGNRGTLKYYSSIPEIELTGVTSIGQRFKEIEGEDYTMSTFYFDDAIDSTVPTGSRGLLGTLVYPSSGTEYSTFLGKVPSVYEGRPFDVNIQWTSSQTGNVIWSAEVDSYASGTIDSNNFGAPISGTFTTSESGVIQSSTINLTAAATSGITNDDHYAIRIGRHADSDTLNGSVNLISVEVKESPLYG